MFELFVKFKERLASRLKTDDTKTEPGEPLLALDIGCEFVKAAIFLAKGNKAEVLSYALARQSVDNFRLKKITDLYGVLDTCKLAINRATKKAKILPDQVIVGISGEMLKGKTRILTSKRPNPEQKIDLTELKQVIHEIINVAFAEMREECAKEAGRKESEIKLVDLELLELKVDQKRVRNPIGSDGKELSFYLYNAFSTLEDFNVLTTLIAELDVSLLAHVSTSYAVSQALSDENKELEALVIDVGGMTTDILLMLKGKLVDSTLFAMGGASFTKRLQQNLNLGYEDAEAVKFAYIRNDLERNSHAEVRQALKKDAEMWLTGVTLAIENLKKQAEISALPSSIILLGAGSKLPEIREVLLNYPWWSDLGYETRPELHEPKLEFDNITSRIKDFDGPEHIAIKSLINMALVLGDQSEVIAQLVQKNGSLIKLK